MSIIPEDMKGELCQQIAAASSRVESIARTIKQEFCRASNTYPPFASAHEGYAIMLEEVDELWDEVKKSPKNRDPEKMRAEAIQVAAMALRFLHDCC